MLTCSDLSVVWYIVVALNEGCYRFRSPVPIWVCCNFLLFLCNHIEIRRKKRWCLRMEGVCVRPDMLTPYLVVGLTKKLTWQGL